MFSLQPLDLAHTPTPLEQPQRLAEALDLDLWVKRDDATAGAESGNKIRKLEFLLADAIDKGCDSIVTCGGMQSNHARATALVCARLGLRCVLLLRDRNLEDDGGSGIQATSANSPLSGNLLLDRLAGADVRLISATSYARRNALMSEVAKQLPGRPYIVPEGGSNAIGSLGYVQAMGEVKTQLEAGGHAAFDRVIVACGSGGTAAGLALGCGHYGVAKRVHAMAVCNSQSYFETVIERILADAKDHAPGLASACDWQVDARYKGPAYAVSTAAQRADMLKSTKLSGLVFDPVYTGKAMHALWELQRAKAMQGERVLFVHTGGLPGLLAQAEHFENVLP
jgi:D-cysteine desulfhydrase